VLEHFRLVRELQVAFEDVDMLRHVNHIAFVRWAETMRCDYVADVLREDIFGTRGIIGAKIEFTYEAQVSYRERLVMGARVSRLGTKSLDHTYEFWSKDRGVRCAHGLSVVVAFDYPTNATIAIPPPWRERILAFEATSAPIGGRE
jgi:acyl-CoA thioester hydrolase